MGPMGGSMAPMMGGPGSMMGTGPGNMMGTGPGNMMGDGMMGGPGGPGSMMGDGPGNMMGMGMGNTTININNTNVNVFRGQRYVNVGGYRRSIVAIAALPIAIAAVSIAGAEYYADSYVSLAAVPAVCTGSTDEGCMLQVTDVPLDDGSTTPVCMQYCPQ